MKIPPNPRRSADATGKVNKSIVNFVKATKTSRSGHHHGPSYANRQFFFGFRWQEPRRLRRDQQDGYRPHQGAVWVGRQLVMWPVDWALIGPLLFREHLTVKIPAVLANKSYKKRRIMSDDVAGPLTTTSYTLNLSSSSRSSKPVDEYWWSSSWPPRLLLVGRAGEWHFLKTGLAFYGLFGLSS